MNMKNHSIMLPIVVLVAVMLVPSTQGATYTVGDNMGWQTPTGGDPYGTWASQHTFNVGDVLVFNFATGSHTVANVSQSSYNSCNTGNPLSVQTTGPATFTITTSGPHYFICTVPGHCNSNQKLTVNTGGGSGPIAPAPPGTNYPPPPPPPPPPHSVAAPAAAIGAFSFMVMSIGIGLLLG